LGLTHLALVGPTASGKSALALAVARAFGDIEIVSVDSMQVYRGMDVGTAKPSPAERAAVAHHLIDVADPWEDWSVARFQAAARAAVAEVETRGRRALLVGGTGLYVQAVVDDLSFPGEDLALRAELESWTAAPGGVAAAYAELESADPIAAAKIDPHNARRIVRALEVIRLTGRPFSSFGPGLGQFGEPAFPVRLAGVWLPRAALSRRIDDRFGAMRERGLVDEVRRLAADPRGLSRSAAQAIGYKEVLAALDGPAAGESTRLDEAFDLAVRRTRSFARRQRMWFRRDPRISWLATTGNPCLLAPQLLALWGP
jgi:tRNA dimethylallyltransferase